MVSEIPRSMRAIALARLCEPSEYELATLPTPEISKPDQLLIRVHAASVNPMDVKIVTSALSKYVVKPSFPYKLGHDLAGVVVAVGSSVSHLKPGDEVYSCIPYEYRGSLAEYALSTASTTVLKPKTLTFSQAAAMPLVALTALQALRRGEDELKGGLKGTTVYIPGGLSGTGSFGVQLAKKVFGAGKVITTLSTGKLSKIKPLLGDGTPDQIVDYTKEDVTKAIGKGTVDFMVDTTIGSIAARQLMKEGGQIVSVSMPPSGKLLKKHFAPNLPIFVRVLLDVIEWLLTLWMRWKGVNYSFIMFDRNKKDLESLARWVDEGRLRPVVGMQVKLEDIKAVREGCQQVLDGKGGLGKLVIDVI